MLPIAGAIAGIFRPIAELIDNLHTSDEEKALAQAALARAEAQAIAAATSAVVAEATSDSWLTRSWRPITMLVFLALAVGDSLALLPNALAPEAWQLLKIGLGGYVIGRSVEKGAAVFRRT